MKKLLVYGYLLPALVGLTVVGCFYASRIPRSVRKVCYKQHCLKVRLASTPGERERGLMFERSLAADQGMLFVFDREDIYAFWMKNTYIPLDIVWINAKCQVVYIKNDAQPCSEHSCVPITSPRPARYVLEGKSGFANQFGLKVGEGLDFVY